MLKPARSYEEACRTFRWRIPERYNVAFDVCDRQTMAGADGHRTALIVEAADGSAERYTFHVLRLLSNRLANVLASRGVRPDDRVVVSFGPSAEAAVTVLAVAKMGAVAVPVPDTLGTEPLAWRLADSGAVAAVVDGAVAPRLVAVRDAVPGLAAVLAAGDAPTGTDELWSAMELASDQFTPALTAADDPAFVFYPRHAAGKPAGAVHAHRSLAGNLPAVEFALGFFPQFGDIMVAADEWMSLEGLLWSLLPAWHHGVPVVAGKGSFRAEATLGLMARHGGRVAVLPAHHLSALADAAVRAGRHPLPRAMAVHGPAAGTELNKVAGIFGVPANEIWGTLETGAVVASNGAVMESRPGSPGRAAPGVTVEAVDEHGRVMRAGENGMLAVAPGAPGGFLGYAGEDPPGRMRLPSGWLMTGRIGSRDLDGYVWPEATTGEGDAVVAGLPVVLDEVEGVMALHPKVRQAALVWTGSQLKAFVVLADGADQTVDLARELQSWCTARRAVHEAPTRIQFVGDIPRDEAGRPCREMLVRDLRLTPPDPEERPRY